MLRNRFEVKEVWIVCGKKFFDETVLFLNQGFYLEYILQKDAIWFQKTVCTSCVKSRVSSNSLVKLSIFMLYTHDEKEHKSSTIRKNNFEFQKWWAVVLKYAINILLSKSPTQTT